MTFWQFIDHNATGLGFIVLIFIITLPSIINSLRGASDEDE